MTIEHPALSNASKFCDIAARARQFKLAGCWEGSSYRNHPCGLYRQGLLFTNHWHTSNSCEIKVASDPKAQLLLGSQDSFGSYSPHPRPSSGSFEKVWDSGRWNEDGPWRTIASEILYEVEKEIQDCVNAKEAKRAEEEAQWAREREEKLENLRKTYAETGESK